VGEVDQRDLLSGGGGGAGCAARLAVAVAVRRRGGAAIAGLLGLNAHMFGSPFVTPYDRVLIVENHRWAVEPSHRTFFTVPFWRGLWTQLTHPTLGLVVGAPPFLLALPGFALLVRRARFEALLVGGACLAQLALFAKYEQWNMSSYGPRFLLSVVALSALPAAAALAWCSSTRAGARSMQRLSGLLRPRRWMLLVLGFAVIEVVYVFVVSAGRFTHWPTYLTFLDDQAEGFRARHLHFAIEPAAALVAKANPFDPAWKPLWYWDASLYNGHYYLYWGPAPALCWRASRRSAARVRGSATSTWCSRSPACRRSPACC
jgi:hypothetical protein